MTFRQFTLALIGCIWATSLVAQPGRARFVYGVNGHPLTQEAYSNNLDLQIQLLKRLNARFYRVDVPVDPSGKVIRDSAFVAMLRKMQANGIRVLPVLVFSAAAYADRPASNAYADGLAYGRAFARRYKRFFSVYEVGNEEDNQTILGAQVHGNLPEHFDTPHARVIVPYVKGVCKAIRQEDRSAKLIIDMTWVHYGFLQRLAKAGVSFDYTGCHWYADMGDLQHANAGFGNVADTLFKLFRKPVWVTEINVRGGVPSTADATKEGWLARNLTFLRNNPHVGAVFVYELLDQPAFAENRPGGVSSPGEAAYGLGAWRTKYKGIREKPLFNQYQAFIRRHP